MNCYLWGFIYINLNKHKFGGGLNPQAESTLYLFFESSSFCSINIFKWFCLSFSSICLFLSKNYTSFLSLFCSDYWIYCLILGSFLAFLQLCIPPFKSSIFSFYFYWCNHKIHWVIVFFFVRAWNKAKNLRDSFIYFLYLTKKN